MKRLLRRIIRRLWGWQSPYECYWRDRALKAEKQIRELQLSRLIEIHFGS